MRWCSWFRHHATSRKVAGSIPSGVIGIFHWHYPSSHTMALGLTQPLTEMHTRNIYWWVKAASAEGWQPYHLHVPTVLKSGSPTSWDPQGLSRPVMGLLDLYYVVQMTKGLLNSLYCQSVCAVCTFSRALCSCTYSQGSASKLTFTGNVNSQLVNSVFFLVFPAGIRVGHHAEIRGQHWLKGVLRYAQAGVSWDGHVDETLSYTHRMSTAVLLYVHADVAWDCRAY